MNNTELRNGLERGWIEDDFVANLGLKDVDEFNRKFGDLYKHNPNEKKKKERMLKANRKTRKMEKYNISKTRSTNYMERKTISRKMEKRKCKIQ